MTPDCAVFIRGGISRDLGLPPDVGVVRSIPPYATLTA